MKLRGSIIGFPGNKPKYVEPKFLQNKPSQTWRVNHPWKKKKQWKKVLRKDIENEELKILHCFT